MSSEKRFFIVDVMAMAYRTFFGVGSSRLSRKDGLPTGAIYGSAMFINKLLAEKPDYLAFVTDRPGKTFRHDMYKDYKAHRDAMPEDLSQQIPHIFSLIKALGFEVYDREGFEADDLIGTFATKFSSNKVHAYIVSGDKDFYQLISDRIFLYAPKKHDRIEVIDIEGVADKFHCTPDQVIDCLALIGDTADNVPGVKGIGEKGAAQLISTYGSLEGIYENLDKITAKRQKNGLEQYKDEAFLSKKLVTIERKIPIEQSLKDFNCDSHASTTSKEILEFYQDMEFKSLAKKVADASGEQVEAPKAQSSKVELKELNEGEFADFLEGLKDDKPVAIHPIIEGGGAFQRKVNGIHISQERNSIFFDLNAGDGRDIRMHYLSSILADPSHTKVGFDLKPLVHSLVNEDLNLEPPFVDLRVADYLITPNENRRDLEYISEKYGLNFEPGQESALYLKLYRLMTKELQKKKMSDLLMNIEMPLLLVLAKMEHYGVHVDSGFLLDYSKELDKGIKKLEKKIFKLADEEFNIKSTKQLAAIIFEKLAIHEELGVKRIKKTKSGFSTDESVLSSLSAHPLPEAVLEYRALTKLKSTYVDALPQHIDDKSGRIHTSFRQTVAATGRLSSENPNIQNIPMRREEGRLIRKAFTADRGYRLISADYSQVEIRLLAGMAKEKHLIEAFKKGQDIHTATAAKIFGLDIKAVDSNMRSRAKAINFGIIYGMGPQRLAQETGVTLPEAKAFIAKYFETYPGIKTFTEGLKETAREDGYTTTLLGRRRPVPGLNDGNRAVAVRAENIAVNTPIQGTAADIIKLAMIRIDAELKTKRLKARLIMQVHDELVVECHQGDMKAVEALVKKGMEEAYDFAVPLLVEMGTGKNWFESH